MLRKLLSIIFKKNIIVLKQSNTLQRNENLEKEANDILKQNQKKKNKL